MDSKDRRTSSIMVSAIAEAEGEDCVNLLCFWFCCVVYTFPPSIGPGVSVIAVICVSPLVFRYLA